MSLESQERTEQPTQARREEAWRRGQTARSRDLNVALSLVAGFVCLTYVGPGFLDQCCEMARSCLASLGGASGTLTPEGVSRHVASCALFALWAVVLVALLGGGSSVAASILQTGFRVRPEAVSPDLSRLYPLEGLRRFFNAASLMRGVFAMAKLLVAGLAGAWLVQGTLDRVFPQALQAGAEGTLRDSWRTWTDEFPGHGARISMALVLLALADWGFQRWKHERDLRMTRAELREEIQRLEGSQEHKAQRRRQAASRIRDGRDGAGGTEVQPS